jgi:hypothetical protein
MRLAGSGGASSRSSSSTGKSSVLVEVDAAGFQTCTLYFRAVEKRLGELALLVSPPGLGTKRCQQNGPSTADEMSLQLRREKGKRRVTILLMRAVVECIDRVKVGHDKQKGMPQA